MERPSPIILGAAGWIITPTRDSITPTPSVIIANLHIAGRPISCMQIEKYGRLVLLGLVALTTIGLGIFLTTML